MDVGFQILEEVKTKGKNLIYQWVNEIYREDLHLDFKCKSNPDVPHPSDEDRKNYSKALSGFANSDSGVIVWGVQAPGSGTGHRATEPIYGVRAFAEHLDSLASRLVNPPISGVMNHVIYENEDDDTGYVVSYVPRSELAPHRAEAESLKQYYKRYGDSFKRTEHYELEYMFGKRFAPQLEVFWGTELVRINSDQKVSARINIGVTNQGKAIAKYACLRVRFDKMSRYRHKKNHEVDLLHYSNPKRSAKTNVVVVTARSAPELVIYPADHMIFFVFTFECTLSDLLLNQLPPFTISYDLFAEDFNSVLGEIFQLTGRKVCEHMKKRMDSEVLVKHCPLLNK